MNISTLHTVSEGCVLWERDRIKAGMTLLGYWRLLALPAMPWAASNNNPVALLVFFSQGSHTKAPNRAWELIWFFFFFKEKGCRGRRQNRNLSLLSSCTSMPHPMRQETRLYYWPRMEEEMLSVKRRYTPGYGLIYCVHHTGVCYWVNRPDLSSSECQIASLKP